MWFNQVHFAHYLNYLFPALKLFAVTACICFLILKCFCILILHPTWTWLSYYWTYFCCIECYSPSHVWDLSVVVLIFLPLCSHFDIHIIYTSFMKWFRTPFVLFCALEQFRKCFILKNVKNLIKPSGPGTFIKGNSASFSGNLFAFIHGFYSSCVFSSWIKLSNLCFSKTFSS